MDEKILEQMELHYYDNKILFQNLRPAFASIDFSLMNAITFLINKIKKDDVEDAMLTLYNREGITFNITICKLKSAILSKITLLNNSDKNDIHRCDEFTDFCEHVVHDKIKGGKIGNNLEELIFFCSFTNFINLMQSGYLGIREIKTQFLVIESDENGCIDLKFTEELQEYINENLCDD